MNMLTKAEFTLISVIPENFKYIARNSNGKLKCFYEKPIFDMGIWREKKQKRPVGLRAWQRWFKFIKPGEFYEIQKLLNNGYNDAIVKHTALKLACREISILEELRHKRHSMENPVENTEEMLIKEFTEKAEKEIKDEINND